MLPILSVGWLWEEGGRVCHFLVNTGGGGWSHTWWVFSEDGVQSNSVFTSGPYYPFGAPSHVNTLLQAVGQIHFIAGNLQRYLMANILKLQERKKGSERLSRLSKATLIFWTVAPHIQCFVCSWADWYRKFKCSERVNTHWSITRAFTQQLLGAQDYALWTRWREDTVPSLESSLSGWELQLPPERAMN